MRAFLLVKTPLSLLFSNLVVVHRILAYGAWRLCHIDSSSIHHALVLLVVGSHPLLRVLLDCESLKFLGGLVGSMLSGSPCILVPTLAVTAEVAAWGPGLGAVVLVEG